MSAPRQRIVRERRQYNKWVASQTLEDYALRFTASRARKFSAARIAHTAFGAISFLACEAIGATLTLAYGFPNAAASIVVVCALMFVIGLPIAWYAARYGLDIDLLTRGAGFGYMGSTITSLIYASFTFLLLSFEASIMSSALKMTLGIPLPLGHLISALVVIPIAIYGVRMISRMQMATQPLWLVLQLLPLLFLIFTGKLDLDGWRAFTGQQGSADGSLDLLLFSLSASTLLSLLPQIGEQADYLRFLPERERIGNTRWWAAVLWAGPGWVFMGGLKLMTGSLLAWWALEHGIPAARAVEPSEMFYLAFSETVGSPLVALTLTGLFVVVCQIKINVTNAYAGSIAWSNFFSRLTHAHPGRVVWLVFNVLLALLLMEVGILRVIEGILIIYANFAVAWIGALTGDLVINKPLGLSPRGIEFKRAHLYDINPVGVGAMALSIIASSAAFVGAAGELARALSPFIGLGVAFVSAPLLAWATRSRFYLAREAQPLPAGPDATRCSICENVFEHNDMAMCPAYRGPICSLCCTLEARCHDLCKTDSRLGQQLLRLLSRFAPPRVVEILNSSTGQFLGLVTLFALLVGSLLWFIYQQYGAIAGAGREAVGTTLWIVFLCLMVLCGIAAWLLVLAHESRRAAEQETQRQTTMLLDEIEAHERTDAALQKAKEVAESANEAKSRYIIGISHEIRSPLNAIAGYAQLLERGAPRPENAVKVIRRSATHLSNLVDGLLEISRIESGMLRLARDRVRFAEFMEQLVDMFRLQAAAKGIGFVYERPPVLPRLVHADQKRLRQILINLLSNAVKYSERGQVCLRLRYSSGQIAEFEVSDSGIGIRADELEKIFKPFERGSMPGVQAVPGVGMGLTITQVLVQIMGGEIQVQSTPGVGSRFSVRLLLSEAPSTREDAVDRRRIVGYRGPRRRVLVADDDPSHLELVVNVLQPLGFDVFTAVDGFHCLEMASACAPELAMLDIAMPVMNGWEVARELRAARLPHPPKVLIVSANAHEYRPGDDHSPHHAFITKPLEISSMLETIGALLDLEWIHDDEDDAEDAAPVVSATMPLRSLLSADFRPHLDELMQLGRIGHVRGIEAKLQEMTLSGDCSSLVERLRQPLSRYDLKAYLGLLQELRHDA